MNAGWRSLPRAWQMVLACLAAYVVVPWPGAKLVLVSALLASVASAPACSFVSLRRPALALCFALAFLVLPGWLYFGGQQPAPIWQVIWFGALAVAGWAWLRSVDSLTGAPEPSPAVPWWKAAFVATALLAVNWSGFYQVVPSRGDESQHILRLWVSFLLAQFLLRNWLAPLSILLALVSLLLWRRKRRDLAAAALGTALGLWICAVIYAGSQNDLDWLPRYPSLQMWWQATALLYAPVKKWVAQEALYRIVPFAAVLVLALYIMRAPLARASAPAQLGAALAVATVPTVHYYSTLLYLDLPLAVAMAIACFEIERMVCGARQGKMPASAGWYALLLAGFLKETALPFLAIAVLFLPSRPVRRWLQTAFAVAMPLLLFLMIAGVQRRYSFRAANLLTLSNYRILATALWEQYGLLLGLAVVGVVLLAAEKRLLLIGFSLAVVGALTVLYVGDGAVTVQEGVVRPKFLGHSRFMLAWLPGLAVFSVHALRLLPKAASWSAAGILLAGNLWVYGVSTVAAPVENWGDYVSDTSDHFYPYNAAFERGRAQFPQAQRVLVVGPDFYYPYMFYQRRWSWPSSIEAITLPPRYSAEAYRRCLGLAIARQPDLLWVHVMSHLPLSVYQSEAPGYEQVGEHRSRFHRILVYRRRQ